MLGVKFVQSHKSPVELHSVLNSISAFCCIFLWQSSAPRPPDSSADPSLMQNPYKFLFTVITVTVRLSPEESKLTKQEYLQYQSAPKFYELVKLKICFLMLSHTLLYPKAQHDIHCSSWKWADHNNNNKPQVCESTVV